MLRLCDHDPLGMVDFLPPLLLRVNRDQECYNWLQRWCEMSAYDPGGRMNMGLMGVKNADPFGPDILDVIGIFTPFEYINSLALLKTKLLLDLIALDASADLRPMQHVPVDIFNAIRSFVPCSPVISGNRASKDSRDHTKQIKDLDFQLKMLHAISLNINRGFWGALFNPGYLLTEPLPDNWTPGTMGQMQFALQDSYSAWAEAPGAIDFVKAKTSSGEWSLFP